MKKIEAVFCDLDGTWLNDKHQIPQQNLEILQKLRDKNIPFHVATGRSIESIKKIKNLDPRGLTVCSNGSLIVDLSNNDEIISQSFIPKVAVQYLEAEMQKYGLTGIWYTEGKVFVSAMNDLAEAYFNVADIPIEQGDLKDFFDATCLKILFKDYNEEKLEIVRHDILKRPELGIWGTYSLPNTLEVLNLDASKGAAIEHIAKIQGYNLENCVAFGDNHNDLQMLKTVGHGVAMENGRPEIVAQFKNRARSSSEAGVALYLTELLKGLDA